MTKILILETQFDSLLNQIMASEDNLELSVEKFNELFTFYKESYPQLKRIIGDFLDELKNVSVEDLLKQGDELIEQLTSKYNKVDGMIEEYRDEISLLDSYAMDFEGGKYYDSTDALYKQYNRLSDITQSFYMIVSNLEEIVGGVENKDDISSLMSDPMEIEEEFASKKQQRYFYAKANDESLSQSERDKWLQWANEFSDETNFDKLPEKV